MWKHLRAIFVLFHLAAVGALCIPAPVGGLNQRSYNDPNIRKSFSDYAGMARSIGIDISRQELQDIAWDKGQWLLDTRKAALAPFVPYYRWTGTEQGWRMFGYVNRKPARIEVWLQTAPHAEFAPLYVARSDDHVWRRRQLDQERFRGLLNSHSHRRAKSRFGKVARWFAREAALDFPAAHAVRVQMRGMPTPTPEELRQSGQVVPGETFWQTDLPLAEFR